MKKDFGKRLKEVEKIVNKMGIGSSIIFDNILNRSRILLSSRSDSDVNAIAGDIEQILDEYYQLIEDAFSEIWEKYGEVAPTRFSTPQLLRFCVGSIPIEERGVVKDPEWSEYFAVFALDHLARFLDEIKERADIFDDIYEGDYSCDLSCMLIFSDIQEALTMAESLDEGARLSSEISQLLKAKMSKKTSQQNKSAARRKHKKTNDLLRKLVPFYQNGDFKSMKEAVQAFLVDRPEIEYNHLVPTNRERTLYNGLSDVLNGRRELD
ncbi:MAG: hypothetical protein KME53_09875 [Candidatus Thiodiazotropha sp. (ex Clathrolucina costata)]|nr:hypothetical protein [Candidatus Thiodiazotropha taylori]